MKHEEPWEAWVRCLMALLYRFKKVCVVLAVEIRTLATNRVLAARRRDA